MLLEGADGSVWPGTTSGSQLWTCRLITAAASPRNYMMHLHVYTDTWLKTSTAMMAHRHNLPRIIVAVLRVYFERL